MMIMIISCIMCELNKSRIFFAVKTYSIQDYLYSAFSRYNRYKAALQEIKLNIFKL